MGEIRRFRSESGWEEWPDGAFVYYKDHLAALSAAEQRGIEKMRNAAKVDETLTGRFFNLHLDEIADRLLSESPVEVKHE